MSISITMPALSPTMTEGTLSKWLVKEGDTVSVGDVLAEIETDKATMEVEAIDEGIVTKILFPSGSKNVKVNSVIAILSQESEAELDPSPINTTVLLEDSSLDKSNLGSESSKIIKKPLNTGKADCVEADTKDLVFVNPEIGSEGCIRRVFASPLARRLAKNAGIDLSRLRGSGPHGRIISRDLDNINDLVVKETLGIPCSSQLVLEKESDILNLFPKNSYSIKPHDLIRKTIARRLSASKQTIPHFYVTIECELDPLLRVRAEMNAAGSILEKDPGAAPIYKISVNDLIMKAVGLSLKMHPEANASWLEEGMVYHKHVDAAVAVALPGGLITPIVRKIETKTVLEISNEIKELVSRARAKKLKPCEYEGGTVSVSNLGMFGVKEFSAIVNPPQALIFAIGAGIKQAVVKEDKITSATVMTVTVASDHRVIDGALAAELMATFKRFIENPIRLLL